MSAYADGQAKARVQRAARSARLREPRAVIDTYGGDHPEHDGHCMEVVIPGDICPPTVAGAICGERLDIQYIREQGGHCVVLATP